MQSFIIVKEIFLTKCPINRTVSSYRKDLNLVRLILIFKFNYKIVLYEIYFNSRLQVCCKISI
jgi:hypothetical protein